MIILLILILLRSTRRKCKTYSLILVFFFLFLSLYLPLSWVKVCLHMLLAVGLEIDLCPRWEVGPCEPDSMELQGHIVLETLGWALIAQVSVSGASIIHMEASISFPICCQRLPCFLWQTCAWAPDLTYIKYGNWRQPWASRIWLCNCSLG